MTPQAFVVGVVRRLTGVGLIKTAAALSFTTVLGLVPLFAVAYVYVARYPLFQRWLEAFNCIVALIFCAGMIWYGWQIVDTSLLLDERSSSGLQFPMWIYYSALPAGGVLMAVRYLIRLFRYLFVFDPKTMSVGHHIGDHELPSNIADLANR